MFNGFKMKNQLNRLVFIFIFLSFFSASHAELYVGVGKTELTPPLGTPSAGYPARKAKGMEGVHDPLLAVALFIDNGEKQIVLCSVDHLGFTYEMVQNITQQIQKNPGLSHCEIYIGSSHTHSGGGSYLNIPLIGENLAGPYHPEIAKFYEGQTEQAILAAYQSKVPAKMGLGYGKAENLSFYRGLWPKDVEPLSDVTVMKVTQSDETPLAVLFNFPVHPTVLTSQNELFSADFVGYARDEIQALLGSKVQAMYFNGAQGDILPVISHPDNRWEACQTLGKSLAQTVVNVCNTIEVKNSCDLQSVKHPYEFVPEATPQGLKLPLKFYKTEINLLVFNQKHAFFTIPGELSCLYDRQLRKLGEKDGFQHVSILGLTNDAHGYIILPESWEKKTFESNLSFGGKEYGERVMKIAEELIKRIK